MRFIIKPHDRSAVALLGASQYQRVWEKNVRIILKGMRETTGLDFQQTTITAHVHTQGSEESYGGGWRLPMMLHIEPTEERQLWLIIHELCHRLLNGNCLSPIDLGIYTTRGNNDDEEYIEKSHRHMYLFEYDFIRAYLGEELAATCERREFGDNIHTDGHSRVWQWAMNMKPIERQRAMKILAAEAVLRDEWDAFDKKPLPSRDSEEWYRLLNPNADPSTG